MQLTCQHEKLRGNWINIQAIERTESASKVGSAKQVLRYQKKNNRLEGNLRGYRAMYVYTVTICKIWEYARIMPTILHIQNYFTDCQTCPSAARQQIGTNFEYKK